MRDHPRCKTCRHWDRDHRDDSWGFCDLARMCMDHHNPRLAKHPESLAVAEDASHYAADLVTAPDFGCVQHEPQAEGR